MTIISITPVSSHQGEIIFRAFCQGRQSTGKTEGEALDGLTAQLAPDEPNVFVVLQRFQDDDLFTGVQKQQLQQLMTRWREARDSGQPFPPEDQQKLENLVEAEQRAAGIRAGRLAAAIKQ